LSSILFYCRYFLFVCWMLELGELQDSVVCFNIKCNRSFFFPPHNLCRASSAAQATLDKCRLSLTTNTRKSSTLQLMDEKPFGMYYMHLICIIWINIYKQSHFACSLSNVPNHQKITFHKMFITSNALHPPSLQADVSANSYLTSPHSTPSHARHRSD
jgi:hypothetical protein